MQSPGTCTAQSFNTVERSHSERDTVPGSQGYSISSGDPAQCPRGSGIELRVL